MSWFEESTAVQQVSENEWRGEIHRGWRIGPVPNGGYVLAIAGRVLSLALPHPDPLTVHILYTAPTVLGPLECTVERLRSGGSISHASATLRQEGEAKARVTACYCSLDRLRGENWAAEERPLIPPVDELPPLGIHGIELRESVHQHYHRGRQVFKRGAPDRGGVFDGWLQLADGADAGALGLLLFADGMAPPVFTVFGPLAWVPTLELSVQLRAHPAPGPVQVRFRSRYMSRGIVEEDGELWDSTGALVALSRQTSMVRVQRS